MDQISPHNSVYLRKLIRGVFALKKSAFISKLNRFISRILGRTQTCYHVSANIYEIGDTIKIPKGKTSYSHQLSSNIAEWRVRVLDDARDWQTSRSRAVFGADSPENAMTYYEQQSSIPGILYEVKCAAHITPCPMAIITYMDRVGPNFPKLTECVSEYWNPHQEWSFLEYVCPKMKVIRKIDTKEIEGWDIMMATSMYGYMNDQQLLAKLWGPPLIK